jgi:lysophospholipase L1-like esterase
VLVAKSRRRFRASWRPALGALLAVIALSATGIAWPAPAAAQGTTIQALAIGDSITWWNDTYGGYGPAFERKFERRLLGKAAWRSQPGSNPCTAPWAQWVADFPKPRLDYLIVQDDYRPGACESEDLWRQRWQEVVDVAKSKGAFVIVLDGTHPDLSTVQGIDILDHPVPPPDLGDGVHYTRAGYKYYAKHVVDLLDSRIA